MTFHLSGRNLCRMILVLVMAGLAGAGGANAAPAFVVRNLALYQPNAVLVARLGNDAAPLGGYFRQIEAREAAVFASVPPRGGVSGAIVVAIKPGRQSRAWLVLGANRLPSQLAAQVKAEAEAVFPVSVRGGPVALAIVFDAWGGGQPVTDPVHPAPVPSEWGVVTPGEALPDGPLGRIWP